MCFRAIPSRVIQGKTFKRFNLQSLTDLSMLESSRSDDWSLSANTNVGNNDNDDDDAYIELTELEMPPPGELPRSRKRMKLLIICCVGLNATLPIHGR